MIDDGEIDLTIEQKFHSRNSLFSVLPGGRTIRDPMLESLVGDIHRIPWLSRPITSDMGFPSDRNKRLYGDTLSDEMGFIVRSTFNGGWFLGASQKEREHPHFDWIFRDLLFEMGIDQGSGLKPCVQCGRMHLTINPYSPCPKCREEDRVKRCMRKVFQGVEERRW